ncbi:hypothetical protein [Cellulophaga sp. BC115SP]|uniref:hypothetical protein n=1 Tax=Cellulophaga sp. BC115SP TaxID=2683263 RepID=UPI00141305DF|nr:hypothetical protein [Cellulophaga sp. BC115SP]NBB31848.1 hypothetical protein [Cellulophaga sp. BC115SP]
MAPKLTSIIILLITIASIVPTTTIPLGNTFLWWVVFIIALLFFVRMYYYLRVKERFENNGFTYLKLLLIWYLVSIIRGFFVASNYWEWKNLVQTSLTMFLPFIAILTQDILFFSLIFNRWWRVALPLFFLFIPFLIGDGYGRYLAPLSILSLFFPLIGFKQKYFLFFLFILIILSDLDARSNIIKFVIPIILSLLTYVNFYRSRAFLRIVYYSALILPVVFLVLASVNIFNIFKMDEYLNLSNKGVIIQNGREIKLTADTRTFLYKEVIESSIKNNYFIWGRTPARGNDSESFGWYNKELLGLQSKERFANEVSILNIFTWTGIIGVTLYFLIFAKGAYLSIFLSQNQYSKLVGIYILFRWCYAWVEDFTNFDLSYLFLWSVIGLSYSKSFRKLSDYEIGIWIKSLFTKDILLYKIDFSKPNKK